MQNYRGMVLSLSPLTECEPLDYVCIRHEGNSITIIPCDAEVGHNSQTFPLTGEGSWVMLSARRDDDVVRGLVSRLKSMQRLSRIGLTEVRPQLDADIAKLQSLLDERKYHDGKSAVFAAIYGTDGYTGKLVWLEFPAGKPSLSSGEFIVLRETEDSMYVISTASAESGTHTHRVLRADVSVVECYEDDEFIEDFIDRLDDMMTPAYSDDLCDAAETSVARLNRMMDAKPTRPRDFYDESTPMFGPVIGSLDDILSAFNLSGVTTGRTNMGGCSNGIHS